MDTDRMRVLLASTRARIGRAWLQARAHLLEENTAASVEARLHTGDPVQGIAAAASAFAAAELAAFSAAGEATGRWLQEARPVPVRKKLDVYDAAEPGAVRWAQQNRLEVIREITQEQRETIQQILVRGARAGTNPKSMAKEIRESIGLTAYQEQIVANYRRQLEQGGAELQAALDRELVSGTSERSIQAAIRNNRAIPSDRIDAMVDAYRTMWVHYRAEAIARTEGLRVAHQASDELYRQAVARGSVQAEQLERTWVPSRREPGHRREYHHNMLVGVVRGLDTPFVSGHGVQLRHPGDPSAPVEETAHCGCVVTVRIRPA